MFSRRGMVAQVVQTINNAQTLKLVKALEDGINAVYAIRPMERIPEIDEAIATAKARLSMQVEIVEVGNDIHTRSRVENRHGALPSPAEDEDSYYP